MANGLIAEMMEGLGPGEASTEFFGVIIVHKALANAGLGKNGEAVWYWQTAMALAPKTAESTLAKFGQPAKLLRDATVTKAAASAVRNGPVVAPRLLRKVEPAYPRGAHAFAVDGALVVEVTIDKSGAVTSPHIVKPLPAPTLSYAALEAVKQWRFTPGRIAGEPVDVIFNVTVLYRK
jgi:TonB family protein